MIDPLLTNLLKFSEPRYYEGQLKRDFLEPYLNINRCDLENEMLEWDSFTLHIGDTINLPNGESKTSTLKINHKFESFISKKLIQETSLFSKMYFEATKFEFDSIKKEYYTKKIAGNLSNILKSIDNNDNIDEAYKQVVLQILIKFIRNFKQRNLTRNLELEASRKLPHSFTYNYSNPIELQDVVDELLSSLIRGGLISKSTKNDQIRKLLTNSKIKNKILWEGDLQEFKYFIDKLLEHKKVKPIRRYKWLLATKCFLVIDKKTNEEISNHKLKGQHLPSEIKMKKINIYLNV